MRRNFNTANSLPHVTSDKTLKIAMQRRCYNTRGACIAYGRNIFIIRYYYYLFTVLLSLFVFSDEIYDILRDFFARVNHVYIFAAKQTKSHEMKVALKLYLVFLLNINDFLLNISFSRECVRKVTLYPVKYNAAKFDIDTRITNIPFHHAE